MLFFRAVIQLHSPFRLLKNAPPPFIRQTLSPTMKVPELEEQKGRNIYQSRSEYLFTTMLP